MKKMVAIVGARNASANGCRLTQRWAREIGEQGYIVVSGLARGIDNAAHRVALITGTVAVLAGGIDRIYPPENATLYREIAETGCIISESPLGVKPLANLFPKRNRVVSGLSLGVVVVEAAIRSGSLITANCALEQGREVMAIPGSPEDPRSHGTNHLLKQGATLVHNVRSIIDTLAMQVALPSHLKKSEKASYVDLFEEDTQDSLFDASEEDESQEDLSHRDIRSILLEKLSVVPVSLDELIRQCHFSPAQIQTTLLELELEEYVERQSGGQFTRIES